MNTRCLRPAPRRSRVHVLQHSNIAPRLLWTMVFITSFVKEGSSSQIQRQLKEAREVIAREWAPFVWLHPEEQYYPSSVFHFLHHIQPSIAGHGSTFNVTEDGLSILVPTLPEGDPSWDAYLTVPHNFNCKHCPLPNFLYGRKPGDSYSPPMYAVIHSCPPTFQRERRHLQHMLHNDNKHMPTSEAKSERLSPDDPMQLAETSLISKIMTDEMTESSTVTYENGAAASSFHPQEEKFPHQLSKLTATTKSSIQDKFIFDIDTTEESRDDNSYINSDSSITISTTSNSNQSERSYHNTAIKENNTNEVNDEVHGHITSATKSHDTVNEDSPNSASSMSATSVSHNSTSNHSMVKRREKEHDITNREGASQNMNIQSDQEFLHDSDYTRNIFPFSTKKKQKKKQINNIDRNFSLLPKQEFSITYWMFYPYNYGKKICSVNLGYFLGRMFKPRAKGICLAEEITMGNHIGDWEHVSIKFVDNTPTFMYVSAHNFGAYYIYDPQHHKFMHSGQDTRKGIAMFPAYPKITQLTGSHPILFSAKGSHGLWAAPGIHRYSTLPKLEDHTGRGTAWHGWKNLEIFDLNDQMDMSHPNRYWLSYEGHWGNPNRRCHTLMGGFCEMNDGPTGIPRKRINFPCGQH